MSLHSPKRNVSLLTKEECATLFSKSPAAIQRAIKQPSVYVEYVMVSRSGSRGATKVAYIDPETLRPVLGKSELLSSLEVSQENGPLVLKEPELPVLKPAVLERQESLSRRTIMSPAELASAQTKLAKLEPVLQFDKGSKGRSEAVTALAKAEGVTSRAIYQWIKAHEEKGLKGLGCKTRSDKNAYRHSAEQHQLAVYSLVKNPNASIRMLHRWLTRACGLEMSAETLGRINKDLRRDRHTRLMFLNADTRKEFLRTYAGQVFAPYANAMWQLDMTRCDILVWDEDLGRAIRPRIHAIIDVYSGCIVSMVIGVSEDQSQTDAAIAGGLVPRAVGYEEAWPVFGTPEVLYMDNGKTYKSGHIHRYLSDLGVEIVHSRPLVSHTRGKIERFFGTAHGYEKLAPGYTGANAKERSTEELKRLEKITKKWIERGKPADRDPKKNERLLTLAEFRHFMIEMVTTDYHDTIVKGKTRLQHFLGTVPTKSQRLYSEEDLLLVLARRTTRTVNPDGSVRFNNRFWTVESGELATLRGLEVLVLANPVTPEVPYCFAWEPSRGGLELIGKAVLMPERADSDEARALRANEKAAKTRELHRQTKQKQMMDNDHLSLLNLISEQAQAELNIPALPPVQRPQARLEAVSGPAEPEDDLDDDLMFDLGPLPFEPGMDIDDYHEAVKKHTKGIFKK